MLPHSKSSNAPVHGYVVREATPDNAAEALEFFRNVRRESPYLLLREREGIQDVAVQAQQFERMASEGKQSVIFAWHADTLVGFVGISRGAFFRNNHAANLAIAVMSAHQGRGVGGYLLSSALAWAQASNVSRVELCVAVKNIGAVRLYQRHGFVIEGTKRRSFLIADKLVDEHVMAWILPGSTID